MALEVTKVDVWAGDVEDRPGGLSDVLDPLAEAGADLEFVLARRHPGGGSTGDVFVTPVKGRKVQQAAESVGLSKVDDVATLRVEGPDQPGLGSRITRGLADAGISLRGVSAGVVGSKFVAYIGLDSSDDATKAARVLRGLSGGKQGSR